MVVTSGPVETDIGKQNIRPITHVPYDSTAIIFIHLLRTATWHLNLMNQSNNTYHFEFMRSIVIASNMSGELSRKLIANPHSF